LRDHPTIVVWRFVDGKPGHDNQTRGLVRALHDQAQVDAHTLSVATHRHYLFHWILGRFPRDRALPDPDLLLGAGHASHIPMLRARQRRGGRIITLMRPSLPLSWFDLCVLPEHDQRRRNPPNTLITRGVLNTIRPSRRRSEQSGLFLIGGPSDHYDWDSQRILNNIEKVLDSHPGIDWTLTNSRRTPAGFIEMLSPLRQRIRIIPHQDTDRDWVPKQLEIAGRVWVSADSVSMIYEALTAGGRVGVLPLSENAGDRVALGIQRLIDERRLALPGQTSHAPDPQPFNEAERVARWIIERWFNH
jgi:mitochondrial fission protein ELM1